MQWLPLGDGLVGLLSCRVITLMIVSTGSAKNPAYRVRVGGMDTDTMPFATVEDAKRHAVSRATEIMKRCVKELEEEDAIQKKRN